MPEFDEAYLNSGDDVTFMMVDLVDGQRETKKGCPVCQEMESLFGLL